MYTEEFDTPGGEPFSVIIGDYEISHRPSRSHPTDDVEALGAIAQVAAAAFAPFIAGAPIAVRPGRLRGTRARPRFATKLRPARISEVAESPRVEDARFVGLTMPRS